MRTEQEIRERIREITESFEYILTLPPASLQINAPRAIMQTTTKCNLEQLYWLLGEERPHFACDDYSNMDGT